MAPLSFTSPDLTGREDLLVRRLVSLYEEELQVYSQVLQLSHQQSQLIKRGAAMSEIRRLLEKKKQCLDVIGRLEATERSAKRTWDQGKQEWSTRGRTRMHEVLGKVSGVIEQILLTEEKNDLELIEQTRAV